MIHTIRSVAWSRYYISIRTQIEPKMLRSANSLAQNKTFKKLFARIPREWSRGLPAGNLCLVNTKSKTQKILIHVSERLPQPKSAVLLATTNQTVCWHWTCLDNKRESKCGLEQNPLIIKTVANRQYLLSMSSTELLLITTLNLISKTVKQLFL